MGKYMKPFLVEVKTFAVVMADNAESAASKAKRDVLDIVSDDPNPIIEVKKSLVSLAELTHGWDGQCVPYGGDRNTRLHEILPTAV